MRKPPDTIDVRLTGRVVVMDRAGIPNRIGGRQAQTLLAMLVLEGGSVTTERVAEVLWGDELSAHWRGALRGVVSKLRTTLASLGPVEQPISTAHGMIRLDVPMTDNVSRVEALLRLGENDQLEDGDLDQLRDLIGGLHHPLLIHNDSEWAEGQRHRIEALAAHAEQVLLDQLHHRRRHHDAIAWARQVIARDPVNIRAREVLTRLHLEHGDLPAARRAFDDLERILVTEFGQEPDLELAELIRTRHRPRLNFVGLPVSSQHPDAGETFIGREGALEQIGAAWKRVTSTSRCELVVIRGPAGIGKTRLADRALDLLDPPQRLWGRARPGGGRTWGPFVDALARVFAENVALAHLASVAFPSIDRLLPELASRSHPPSDEDDAPRDAALAVARQIIRELLAEPTILVIDDLQWASPDGLDLIGSILTDVSGPLLVLATCRESSDQVAATLAWVARHIAVTNIELDGFDLGELERLAVDRMPSRAFSAGDVARLHRRTGGLPYFACAVMRDARVNGLRDDESVPESVGVWLDNFLGTLDPDQRRVLEVVAVFGTNADLPAVEAVVGGGAVSLADTIDALGVAGLVSLDRRGGLRIPHDLTSRAVRKSMGSARRAVLHRLAGDHLAERNAPAETLAAHWSLAGPSRHVEAVGAHLRAGGGSLEQGAWRTALEHFATARSRATEPSTQISAAIGTGRALIHLREHEQAREVLEGAIDLAAHHGDDHAMAEATLYLAGRAGRGAIIDDGPAQTRRLRAAHDRLLRRGDAANEPRTQILLAGVERELAISLLFVQDPDERQGLLASALGRIRATAEASTNDLAVAILGQRMGRGDPCDIGDRLAELDEVLALPHGELQPGTLIAAHLYRHEERLRTGQRGRANDDLVIARQIADSAHHAYWRWAISTWEALRFLLDGSLAAAEAAFTTAAAARPTVGEAVACHRVNLVTLRLIQGRGEEMLGPLRDAVDSYPDIPTWRAALALTAVETGVTDLAGSILASFVATDFDVLPHDTNRFFALGILGHVAATLGAVPAAERLWDLLDPYRGQLVLLNVYGGGGAYWGPVEWALARLAGVLGRPEEVALALWDDAVDRVRVTPVLAERVTLEAEAAEGVLSRSGADRTGRSGSTWES